MGVKVQKYSLKCTEMTPDGGERNYTLVDEDQFLFVHDRMVQEIMLYYYDNRTDDSTVFITDNSGMVIHRQPDNANGFSKGKAKSFKIEEVTETDTRKTFVVDIHFDMGTTRKVKASSPEQAREIVENMVANGEIKPSYCSWTGDFEVETKGEFKDGQ
jgi:hypothetical protein